MPLLENTGVSGKINLQNNPISNTALTTHIPALRARGISVYHDDIPSDIVTFKDANLEKAIREALGIPTELLKKEDLAQLAELEYEGKEGAKIADLTGIEHSSALTSIDIRHHQISDLSPLANLKQLTSLSLPLGQINDISALSELPNITYLRLHNNKINDISVLDHFPKLTNLELQDNQIRDISVLSKLTNIERLWLHGNQISDISALENMIDLESAHLGGNEIADISPVAKLTNISYLMLNSNRIRDLSPLSKLTKIWSLHLNSNRIAHIEPLHDLVNLRDLHLHHNEITSILSLVQNTGVSGKIKLQNNPLSNTSLSTHIPALEARGIKVEYDMPEGVVLFKDANLEKAIRDALEIPTELLKKEDLEKLKELVANDKEIVDLTGLEFCTNLTKLDLGSNKIVDCSPLSELNNLKELNLSVNPIEDFSFLSKLSSVQELALNLAELKDLSSFRNLSKLRDLNIGHNRIIDLTGISDCKELVNLNLNANGIADLAILKPIQNLPNLSSLHLSHNPINNLQPLNEMKNLHSQITNLHLNSTEIKDLTMLKQFRNLVWLSLDNNGIADLSFVSGLSNLKILGLGDNHISQIASIVQNKEIAGKIILTNNPLSNTALTTDIPALVERGIKVEYDDAPADIVIFKDINLETAIRDALGIPTELLKKEDLAQLKELVVDGGHPNNPVLTEVEKIPDLTGLEHCTDLQLLNLRNHQISDISALATLTKLSNIELSFNQLSNIGPLANLTGLTQLNLSGNRQISDVGSLANLTKLTRLTLGPSQLSNLSGLANLTSLTYLGIGQSKISDISVLANLTKLTWLNFEINQISDISPIAKLTNLTKLNLRVNQVKDLSPLANLTQLMWPSLGVNQISDITPLAENTRISGGIFLKNNPLNNIALSTYIPALKARGITVEYDEAPADIIKMSDSILETALRQVVGIPIEILTPSNTSSVVDLDLTNTGVVDLDMEALKVLTSLKSLNLTNNPLSSNAVLVQIPELESAGITIDLGTSAAAKVELSSEKPAIPASLSATTDITVTVTDANGNKVKREIVDLTVDKGTIQTPAVNNGDGTYTATYAAADVSGNVTITALTSNGKFGSLQIELVEISVSKDKSTLEVVGSNKAKTDETASVVAILVSGDGLPLSGRSVDLKVNPDDKVIINPSTKTDKDGKTTVVFASGKPGLKIITASSGDVELTASVAVIFSGDEIDLGPIAEAETLTAVATKASLPADGESTTKLTITVLDKDGDALTDQKLELEVENGTVGEVVNNNDGTYTATYIAGTKAGEVVITAKTSNGKSATTTITLTEKVDQPQAEATFAVSTLKREQSGSAGEFVSYLVKLEGKNGFADKVTLFATDPPKGIEVTFDPKEVTLSAQDALKTSQMSLTLDEDVAAKDYEITALAKSEAGTTQELTVIVKVESVDLAVTAILLTVKPRELQLSQSLEVIGQLANISEGEVSIPANSVMTLTLTSPAGTITEFTVNTTDDGDYQLATPYTPNEVGEWEISANFSGTKTLKSVSKSSKFKVAKGSAVIAFDNADSALLGTKLELIGNLKPKLADQKVSIKIIKPDGSVPTPMEVKTADLGVFKQSISLDASGAWELIASWDGNHNYGSVTKTLSLDVSAEVGKAIIVLGGGNADTNSQWRTFSSVANHVYKVLRQRQFDDDEDIYFLSPNVTGVEGADTVTTLGTLEKAITDWAKKQVNPQVPLYIYLLSHNLGDQFLLEKTETQEKYLSPQLLDTWLDTLAVGTPVTVVVEACYSGNFISQDGQKSALVDDNRTIIVSASGDKQSKIARSSSFSRTFFSLIESNNPIADAFEQTQDRLDRMAYHQGQNPQIESSGDGNPNQREDYLKIEDRYWPADITSLAVPPNITKISQPMELEEGVSSQRIEVEILGLNISRVYATVIPPDFDPKAKVNNWDQLQFTEFDLAKVSDGKYAATYAKFTQAGDYAVVVNAENADGFAVPVQTIITVGGEDSKAVAKLTGDVNGDGTVNIFDLVIAAGSFGKTGAGIMGDVNGDGGVNIFDLVIVAGNFGKSLVAAPSMVSKIELTTEQKHHIGLAIDQLESNSNRSNAEEIALNILIAILPERLPTQTQLLANYPNPFNPETWIPFQLAQDAIVTATIYDLTGKQIRIIQLGYVPAGNYVESSKAIYWDGRTDTGEQVSSGTYFYQIEAGDYTETRKMVILK